MTMSVLIREPIPSDVEDLGRAHAAAWQAAYAGLMPRSLLDGVTPESRARMWGRAIGTPRGPGERILVAEVDGRPVGFARTGACRDEGAPESLGELWAINIDPAQWGTGVGAALLEAAHRALAEAGFADAVLWVLPGNARARRFYEVRGWRHDGVERDVEMSGEMIAEVCYTRSLSGIDAAGAA
jgi:GNAT superfamily N-acetyltransferase